MWLLTFSRWCHTKPKVFFSVHVSLKKVLGVLVRDKSKVSSIPLTPSLSTEKRAPDTHKFKARAPESPLVFWTGDICLIFSQRVTAECHQDQQVQNCLAHPFCSHLRNQKLVSLALFYLFLEVSGLNWCFYTQPSDILQLNVSDRSIARTPFCSYCRTLLTYYPSFSTNECICVCYINRNKREYETD